MTINVPHTSITLNNLAISQAIAGEGLPLLLLHGWGANIGLVWQLAERMIPLGYRVYALDMPHFGASASPENAWTVFDYAHLVINFLDHHQLDRVYLFGHSFGGRLGLILGADHPHRLYKMALADSAGVRPRLPLATRIRTQTYKIIRDGLQKVGLRSLSNSLRQAYNTRYGSSDFNATSGVFRQTFVNIISQDLLPYASRVSVPTLLFWGDEDKDTPLWMGQLLEKTIPNAGLVVHQGAGHYSYLEHLAETTHVMDYFFKQA